MGLEIERKFLVTNLDFLKDKQGTKYLQGFIPTDGNPGIRIRIINDTASIALKSDIAPGGVRHEFEYQIPLEDALQMIELFCKETIIEKIRYKINYNGFLWEIDVFEGKNEGLVIAEIELANKEQKFDIPPWADKEVTDLKRYCNSKLAVHPYKQWNAEEKS